MKNHKLSLAFYDMMIFLVIDVFLFVVYQGNNYLSLSGVVIQSGIALLLILGVRVIGKIYRQIWRYGGIQCYIRLLTCDAISFFFYFAIERVLSVEHIIFVRLLAFCCMNTLGALTIRMFYRFAYKCGSQNNKLGTILRWMLRVFAAGRVQTEPDPDNQKIKVAIIGAGSVGVGLAEDLLNNSKSKYVPRCFVDSNDEKAGRTIHGLDVLREDEASMDVLKKHHIQEVVFAVPNMDRGRKTELFEYYQKAGFKIKVFDFPVMDIPGKKRQLREFDISDLLFRAEKDIITDKTKFYYKDKVVLITGGGGSIGSELCRQLAKMEPRQLVVLDVYENCAYDLQQSLNFAYRGAVDIQVEIASIRDKKALARVFKEYRPNICINAAAHKHVPLMEKNCIEQ